MLQLDPQVPAAERVMEMEMKKHHVFTSHIHQNTHWSLEINETSYRSAEGSLCNLNMIRNFLQSCSLVGHVENQDLFKTSWRAHVGPVEVLQGLIKVLFVISEVL